MQRNRGKQQMGKTKDLVKKIRDTKGTFHAKMGSIKDRNGMALIEAEDSEKSWTRLSDLHFTFCVFLPPLLNIFCFCRSITLLSFIVPIFPWNIPLVSLIFFEEISSLSHSIVFLYFFALVTEEGFLISPCYSLELCIQMGISFFSLLLFASLLFSAICKPSSNNHFAF